MRELLRVAGFQGIQKTVGLRLSEYEEMMGADYVEHRVGVYTLRREIEARMAAAEQVTPGRNATSFSGTQGRTGTLLLRVRV